MQFVQNWPFAKDVEVAAKDPSGTILKMADNIVMNGILLSSLSTHLNKMRLDMRVSKVAKEDAEEKLEKMDEKLAAEKTTSHRLREERDALRKQVALLQQKENSLTAELQNEQRQVED